MPEYQRKPIKSFIYPPRYRLHRCPELSDDFDRLFRFSPDGIVIAQQSGIVTRANPALLWMIGRNESSEDENQFSIFDYIYDSDREVFDSCLDMVLNNTLPSSRMEANFVRADGTNFPAAVAFGSFKTNPRPMAQIIIHDISDYKSSEEQNLKAHMELEMSYTATLHGWSRALELRDRETQGHSQRVTDKTVEIALRIGISLEKIIHVRHGALLHDIGKMAIPDSILFKPGPLTTYERNVMEQHPTYAYNLLSPIKYLQPALTIPYSHHEKWDGSGYPQGIKEDQIPVEARIFSVVDVWDALISDRPYRSAWSEEKAKQFLWDNRGIQFDPAILDEFLASM
jgi:PAS domain S-box-containing protein